MYRLTIQDVEGIYLNPSWRGGHREVKSRRCASLMLCTEGRFTYIQKGKKITCEPGQAVYFPKGCAYEEFLHRKAWDPMIDFHVTEEFAGDMIVVFSPDSLDEYLEDYERIRNLRCFDTNRLRYVGIIYGMLDRLAAEQRCHGGPLAKAVAFVEEHFFQPDIDNTQIAEAAGISEAYLRRLFKKEYGVTPHRYMLNARLKLACWKLSEGPWSVGEIAESVGFNGINHFCYAFREYTGMTPVAYRNAYKKGGSKLK